MPTSFRMNPIPVWLYPAAFRLKIAVSFGVVVEKTAVVEWTETALNACRRIAVNYCKRSDCYYYCYSCRKSCSTRRRRRRLRR